MATSHPHLF
jgi:hypothetical protein